MIRKRTILSLALLASTAACGGGGGSSSPAAVTGSAAASGAASNPTGFNNPSVTSSVDANGNVVANTMSTDGSQMATLDLSGDVNPAALLTITAPGMNHTFTLGGPDVLGLENATFNGIAIYNLGDPTDPTGDRTLTNFNIKTETNADGSKDTVVFDVSGLQASNYGIWSHTDANGKTTALGAFSAGTATSAADMASLAGTQATYSGGLIGYGTTAGQNFNMTGTFNANADFGARTVGFNANVSQSDASGALTPMGTLSSNASFAQGSPKFTGSVTSAGMADPLSGSLAGTFYGAGAAEIGGVVNLTGAQTTAAASFGGKKN